jgi:hypothetical protein
MRECNIYDNKVLNDMVRNHGWRSRCMSRTYSPGQASLILAQLDADAIGVKGRHGRPIVKDSENANVLVKVAALGQFNALALDRCPVIVSGHWLVEWWSRATQRPRDNVQSRCLDFLGKLGRHKVLLSGLSGEWIGRHELVLLGGAKILTPAALRWSIHAWSLAATRSS